jgi:protein TonB
MSSKFTGKLAALNRPMRMAAYAGGEYLDQRYFLMTIAAAVALHVAALLAWHFTPKTQVMDIPVSALNIKLGDGDDTTPDAPAGKQQDSKDAVEGAFSKAIQPPPAEAAQHAAAATPVDKSQGAMGAFDKALSGHNTDPSVIASSKLPPAAKQFVRAPKGAGTVLGNSTASDAEVESHYDQTISLWIKKFQVYPEEARAKGLKGETTLRIRIDRQGTIRYFTLEHSTGSEILDRATVDMVKRANPVPVPGPNDYPQNDMLEFLIDIKFNIK